MARWSGAGRIHFFEKPIPLRIYEDAQRLGKEQGADAHSFFMGRVQILTYSTTAERTVEELIIKIIQVFDGEIPKEEFFVKRWISTIDEGLPDIPVNKFYYIMGTFINGDIQLLSTSVQELTDCGYFKNK
ncbi:hypothetical protein ACTRXD_02000 [Nitrospira sp. T9]|uniref:hypothetical protein n=1 Tax=unclassified Nitrospira TaxID=2652172 RepID=UPI003F9C79A8